MSGEFTHIAERLDVIGDQLSLLHDQMAQLERVADALDYLSNEGLNRVERKLARIATVIEMAIESQHQ